MQIRILGLCLAVIWAAIAPARADLRFVSEYELADSEDTPVYRCIFAYDFDLDAAGNIHVLYSLPVPGAERCQVIYAVRTGGVWRQQVIDNYGRLASVSTYVRVDRATGRVHLCYIQDPDTRLVYRIVDSGVVGAVTVVENGGWHSKMELDENGAALFIREGSSSLRLFQPALAGGWTQSVLAIPAANHHRLADFVYDRARHTYHVSYGDFYNQTAPGQGYHRLWYSVSSDGSYWETTCIDHSGTLYEMEFWTALVLDSRGNPYAGMYKYNANNTGTSMLYGRKVGAAWQTAVIAGGKSAMARAGMGCGMAVDESDRLYGAWDNSPDQPIDDNGAHGNIMAHLCRDSNSWHFCQQARPYSAEGYCRLRAAGGKLYLLVSGDHTDRKLRFIEYDVYWAARAVYPLDLTDKWTQTYIWNNAAQKFVSNKILYGPNQAIVTNMNPDGYYWCGVWDFTLGQWAVNDWCGQIRTPQHGRFVAHLNAGSTASRADLIPWDTAYIPPAQGHLVWPIFVNMTTGAWDYNWPLFTSDGTYEFRLPSWNTWYWLVFWDQNTGLFL